MAILSVLKTQEETVFPVGAVFFLKASSGFFFPEDKLRVQLLHKMLFTNLSFHYCSSLRKGV